MALLGALATLVALGIAIPADGLRVRNNINRNVARMEAEGRFRPYDYRLEQNLATEINKNWYDNRDMYPEELIPFFDENDLARYEYQRGMMWEAVIAMGYRPTGCGNFNKFTYNPYDLYEQRHKAEQDAWYAAHYPEKAKAKKEAARLAEEAAQADMERRKRKSWVGVCVVFASVIPGLLSGKLPWDAFGLRFLCCGLMIAIMITGFVIIKKASD